MTIIHPKNEMETIVFFASHCQKWGWAFISCTSSSFPDAILSHSGIVYRVEFEYYASSFVEHEHNPFGCDLIICWNNDFPVPVKFPIWELSTSQIAPIIDADDKSRFAIQEYISLFMELRNERRRQRDHTDHWRIVSKQISPKQIQFIAGHEPKEIVEECARLGINISPRTASNWKQNAIKRCQELGI